MRVFARIALPIALLGLSGCTWWHKPHFWSSQVLCHQRQPYQSAQEVPPLRVPAGLDAPSTQASLVIPTVDASIPRRALKDPCLEEPPRYKEAPHGTLAPRRRPPAPPAPPSTAAPPAPATSAPATPAPTPPTTSTP